MAGGLPTARECCDGLSLQSKNFATAVQAREVCPDVMVPNSEVTQIVDIFRLMCQTELINSFRQEAVALLQLNIVSLTVFLI